MKTTFKGKINSSGTVEEIQFEKGLLLIHPEFSLQKEVIAYLISPGHLLISALETESLLQKSEDPVIATFLSFLAQDMQNNPQNILPLSQGPIDRIVELIKDVQVSDEDSIPDNVTL